MVQRKNIIRWIILVSAVILLITGVMNNSFRDVMIKAVMICMECVGIG